MGLILAERLREPVLKIIGAGKYLPEKVIGNEYFSGRELNVYNSDESVLRKVILDPKKIVDVTGIEERREAVNETSAEMAYYAGKMAIENAGISPSQITGILVHTLTNSRITPAAACEVQKMLGVTTRFAFDFNNACAGFPLALRIANGLIASSDDYFLVIAAENLRSHVDYNDINSTLFGDGAGAVVLNVAENGDKSGLRASYSYVNSLEGRCDSIFGNEKGILRMPEKKRVFKEGVIGMVGSIRALSEIIDIPKGSYIIPHQANGRIVDAIEERLPEYKIFKNLAKYGNVSAATVSIALYDAINAGFIKKGDRFGLTSLGAGFSVSAVVADL